MEGMGSNHLIFSEDEAGYKERSEAIRVDAARTQFATRYSHSHALTAADRFNTALSGAILRNTLQFT